MFPVRGKAPEKRRKWKTEEQGSHCVIRETEGNQLGFLLAPKDRIDRKVLPGKRIVPIIQLPAIMKTGVMNLQEEARGGCNSEMKQISGAL